MSSGLPPHSSHIRLSVRLFLLLSPTRSPEVSVSSFVLFHVVPSSPTPFTTLLLSVLSPLLCPSYAFTRPHPVCYTPPFPLLSVSVFASFITAVMFLFFARALAAKASPANTTLSLSTDVVNVVVGFQGKS